MLRSRPKLISKMIAWKIEFDNQGLPCLPFLVSLIGPLTSISHVARNLKVGGRGSFGQMYRQDVSNLLTNIKEKSKLTKPRAGKFEIR